jgi:hypothetical protein
MRFHLSTLFLGSIVALFGCSSSSPSDPAANAVAGAAATDGGATSAGGDTSGSNTSGSNSSGGSTASGSGSGAGASATGVSLTVTPAAGHTAPGGTVQFSATVTGSMDRSVLWSVQEASGGSISDAGLYTAPMTAGTYHVVATSKADAKVTGTATVSVNEVGNCASLGAAGTWENISPSVVSADNGGTFSKGFSEALVVDPFDPATVWLAVGYQGLLKSTDCGATWAHVNTGRNGDLFDKGSHVSMLVDPVDQGTIYAISIFDNWGFWKSTNGGVDWDQMFAAGSDVTAATNNFADAISVDPADHHHMIVNFHTNCTGDYAPTCEAETKDGGTTWRLFKTPNANWEEGAGAWVIGPNTWLYGGLELYVTQDSGANWNKVTPSGLYTFSGGEVATHPIARTADGTYLLTSTQGLASSTDGLTWSKVPGFAHQVVGFAMGGGKLFTSDQWSSSYYSASESDIKTWATIPPPAALPSDQGAPYLDYDVAHHVLYSSNFAGGTWRLVTQ